MASLNSTGRTLPDAGDIPTFAKYPAFTQLTGPLTLYRFGTEHGRWWYGKSLIDEMKSDFYDVTLGATRVRDPAGTILANPRGVLAISNEWNNLAWLCTMTLGKGDSVDCWAEVTAPQPEWQSKPDGRILHGGLTQYLIYDVSMIPANLISKQSVASLWREFSRTVARF